MLNRDSIKKLVVSIIFISILFSSFSYVSTLTVINNLGGVEVNYFVRLFIELGGFFKYIPLILFYLVYPSLVYFSWRFEELSALVVSSVLLGVSVVDLSIHLNLWLMA